MKAGPCPRCGGKEILENVRMAVSVDRISSAPLVAVGYKRPDALLLKGSVQHETTATICASCGYTELYTANPGELARLLAEPPSLE